MATINRFLTPGSHRILTMLRDSDEELAHGLPRGGWWIGNEQVDSRCCLRLLRLCLVSKSAYGSDGAIEYFHPNEEAEKCLADVNYVPLIVHEERKRLWPDTESNT